MKIFAVAILIIVILYYSNTTILIFTVSLIILNISVI